MFTRGSFGAIPVPSSSVSSESIRDRRIPMVHPTPKVLQEYETYPRLLVGSLDHLHLGIAIVETIFDAVARERLGGLSLWHRAAEQLFFERGLVPNCDSADVFCAGGFQADPRSSGNEYQRPWLRVVLVVSEPDMGAPCLNQHDLVFSEVPVPLDDCAGMKFLGEDQEMLRAIGLRTDLQQELSAGSGDTLPRTAGAKLAFVLVQDGRLRTVAPSRGLRHKAEHADSKTFERVGHRTSSSESRFRGWTSPADRTDRPQSRGEELRLSDVPLAHRECCSRFMGSVHHAATPALGLKQRR